jgi:hypothetical protein
MNEKTLSKHGKHFSPSLGLRKAVHVGGVMWADGIWNSQTPGQGERPD